MSWLKRWFGEAPVLTGDQRQRLEAWSRLENSAPDSPFKQSRCVVVDVETTGLSLANDRLISIGAVAVVNGKIALGDSFYKVLQQETVSEKGNILLHGIGASAQLDGEQPAEALLSFLEYLGKSPLVAFHVTFDQTMIRRALRAYLGMNLKHAWLDLAYVMPGLNPALAKRHHALDDWISHFNIRIDVRHNALADALATAQLLQVASAQASRRDIDSYAGLLDLEKAQRWVSGVS
ncbi:MAG: exonuclease domain-containing protein [Sideroxydans sp.]|nr:exonuclease domain-containing protein [Sideroxydans sp.]